MAEKEVKKERVVSVVTRLENVSIQDLVSYEKAASIVCQKYENSLRQYDGSIAQDSEEYKKFKIINGVHYDILNEIENRLMGLK